MPSGKNEGIQSSGTPEERDSGAGAFFALVFWIALLLRAFTLLSLGAKPSALNDR